MIGVPSMRLLKTIAVFTPEPWQGYGYGADWSETALGGRRQRSQRHQRARAHGREEGPAALGRRASSGAQRDRRQVRRPLDLHQRSRARPHRHGRPVRLPHQAGHEGAEPADVARRHLRHAQHRVRPHLLQGARRSKAWNASQGQTVTLNDHLNKYADIYRGYSTFVKVDPKTGRMLLDQSFQIELPPYTQDLADSGKGASDGFAFINSYNVEMATGGIEQGTAADRNRRVQARLRLPAHHQLEEGRAGRRGRKIHAPQRHPRHLARNGDRRRAAAPGAGAAQPARRGRGAEGRLHHGGRQAGSARHGVRHRQDQDRRSPRRPSKARTATASRS